MNYNLFRSEFCSCNQSY